MNAKERTKLSKRMSYVLRHNPSEVGLELSEAGWVSVIEFLRALDIDFETLEEVVTTNDKQRFEFNEDATMIRASQGHSVDVNLGYSPADPPDVLYHGTSSSVVPTILAEGLRPMSRHHVHMSADEQTAAAVGLRRREKMTILKIDTRGMQRTGHVFYRSTNGVWLTDFVPPRYISV